MKSFNTLVFVLFSFSIISCADQTIKEENAEIVNTLKPYTNHQNICFFELGKFIDSTHTHDDELSISFAYKSINNFGIIKHIQQQEACELYYQITITEDIFELPILEFPNSDKVIFVINGKGLWDVIWAKIIFNKSTEMIEKIEFNHKGETTTIGDVIVDNEFENQFTNLKINFSENNFGLIIAEDTLIKGPNSIDASSGATFTNIGAVKMVNEGLQKVSPYILL